MIKHDSQGLQDYRTSPNNSWTLFQSAINFSSSYQYEYFACHKFPLHHFSLLTLPYDCFCLCFESKVRLNLTAKTLPRLWLNICSIVRVGEPSFNLQILHLQLVLYIPREDYYLSEGRRIFTISWWMLIRVQTPSLGFLSSKKKKKSKYHWSRIVSYP